MNDKIMRLVNPMRNSVNKFCFTIYRE